MEDLIWLTLQIVENEEKPKLGIFFFWIIILLILLID